MPRRATPELCCAIAAAGVGFVTQRLACSGAENALAERLRAAERAFEPLTGAGRHAPPRASAISFLSRRLRGPAISVITPTYNRAAHVVDAIASVVGQTEKAWELILVDDGGDDATEAVVEPFLADRRVRYMRQAHAGQSAARNRGLEAARAPLVAFLDSDNLFFPGFLATARAVFAADPGLDVAYGVLATRHHGKGDTELMFRPFDRGELEIENYIDLNALVCRTEAIRRVGGFDEAMPALEDWDLALRLTADRPATPIAVLAAYYRSVDAQRVSTTVDMEAPAQRVRRKVADEAARRPRP